ncbi:MAG: response regulator transcription factor [Bacillati bacterium ANGP1]|uniref:Response regulator transcription factor n=1 Tax=Candidatus Segetimicrobium genomatis TaxID=2569760 RepID=A0A537LW00_9BACT|nr:MAG: response regulator transcription factor [Terrabacteria group bacterium ANGP1]
MAALRILLVDDHRVIADSLARLLQDDPAIQVVGIAATGPEAISLARLLRPSLVVMDIGLPGMDGVEATWTIRRQCPDVPVLMLTMFEQDAFAIDALRAGAAGYLLKTATPAELFHAIHAVCEGDGLVYPRTATAALQRAVPPRSRVQDPGALSRRELEVLQLVVGGADIAAIGRQLMLSPHTIRNHLKGVYRKLGVRGRVEAAAYAVRRGLIKP